MENGSRRWDETVKGLPATRNLMRAAAILMRHKECEEWDALMDLFAGKDDTLPEDKFHGGTRITATQVWFWGCKRWKPPLFQTWQNCVYDEGELYNKQQRLVDQIMRRYRR